MEAETYYSFFGLSPKCSQEEIRNAYRKLIKSIHPDKMTAVDKNLILRANKIYDTLKNPAKRQEYDHSLKIIKKKDCDFFARKMMAGDFIRSLEQEDKNTFEQQRLKAIHDFKQQTEELNRKSGFIGGEIPLPSEETNKKIEQLETTREQEYIENIPNRLFTDTEMNNEEFNKKFNEIFDATADANDAIIEFQDGVEPYNDIAGANLGDGSIGGGEFASVNHSDKLLGRKSKNVAPKNIEQFMKEREIETKKLDNMKYHNFEKSKIFGANGKIIDFEDDIQK